MSTIVVTSRPIEQWAHGYDLRVANLCREVRSPQHLIIVPLEATRSIPSERTIDDGAIFETVNHLGRAGLGKPRALRHLRLSEEHFLRRAHPEFFAGTVRAIREIRQRTGADRMVVFGPALAGVARAVGMQRVLYDVIDSFSLRLSRGLASQATVRGLGGRCKNALALRRWRGCEGALPHAFAQVTTINEADSEEIRECAGGRPGNVHTVPNGVGDWFLDGRKAPLGPLRHGVAFWGNLEFGPNRDAMRYFFQQIYWPHLQGRGLEICVVGRGAEPWLIELAQRDANVRLLGFVEDLVQVIRAYPVMINPMRTGGGMKNKVLEAFASGLAVVSTELGMESITGAAAGTHHLAADSAEAFAQAVERLCSDSHLRRLLVDNGARLVAERYTWRAVGSRWRSLHDDLW
jgi:hypothetical protein